MTQNAKASKFHGYAIADRNYEGFGYYGAEIQRRLEMADRMAEYAFQAEAGVSIFENQPSGIGFPCGSTVR